MNIYVRTKVGLKKKKIYDMKDVSSGIFEFQTVVQVVDALNICAVHLVVALTMIHIKCFIGIQYLLAVCKLQSMGNKKKVPQYTY